MSYFDPSNSRILLNCYSRRFDYLNLVNLVNIAEYLNKQQLNGKKRNLTKNFDDLEDLSQNDSHKIKTLFKFVANNSFAFCLKVEDDVDFVDENHQLLSELILSTVKLYVKTGVDSIFLFKKITNLYDVLNDVQGILKFYNKFLEYLIDEIFINLSKYKSIQTTDEKNLISEEIIRLSQIYLYFYTHKIVFFKYPRKFFIDTFESSQSELTSMKNILNIIIDIFEQRDFPISSIEKMLFIEHGIELLSDTIKLFSSGYNSDPSNLYQKFLNHFETKIDNFYYHMKRAYGDYECIMFSSIGLFFFNYFETLKTRSKFDLQTRMRIYKFGTKLCNKILDAFCILFSSNPPHLPQNEPLNGLFFDKCLDFYLTIGYGILKEYKAMKESLDSVLKTEAIGYFVENFRSSYEALKVLKFVVVVGERKLVDSASHLLDIGTEFLIELATDKHECSLNEFNEILLKLLNFAETNFGSKISMPRSVENLQQSFESILGLLSQKTHAKKSDNIFNTLIKIFQLLSVSEDYLRMVYEKTKQLEVLVTKY